MNIDLGKKSGDMCCPCPATTSDDKNRIYYPSLYLEHEDLDLPPEGTLTIRYRVTRDTSKTEFKRDGEKEKSHCVDLEVLEIVGVGSRGEKKIEQKTATESLDDLKAESEEY